MKTFEEFQKSRRNKKSRRQMAEKKEHRHKDRFSKHKAYHMSEDIGHDSFYMEASNADIASTFKTRKRKK